MLHFLMTHQDFDKMLAKHLPSNTLRSVKDIVEGLKVKVRLDDIVEIITHCIF